MATESDERWWRLLRFAHELERRGTEYQMFKPPDEPWQVRLTGRRGRPVTVMCAGTADTYVLVTATGRILAPADHPGITNAAGALT